MSLSYIPGLLGYAGKSELLLLVDYVGKH